MNRYEKMSKDEIEEMLKSEHGVTVNNDDERDTILSGLGILTEKQRKKRRNIVLGIYTIVLIIMTVIAFANDFQSLFISGLHNIISSYNF